MHGYSTVVVVLACCAAPGLAIQYGRGDLQSIVNAKPEYTREAIAMMQEVQEVRASVEEAIATTEQETVDAAETGGFPAFCSLPIVLAIAVVALVIGGKVFPYVPPMMLSLFACAAYIGISVAIDLFIAIQKKHGHDGHAYAFNPVCSIIVSEVVKLFISTLVYLQVSWSSSESGFLPAGFTMSDVKWMCLPAIIFTINNILVYEAIGKNDMAGFGVFRDTMILWTAAMWRVVFKTELGYIRIGGIFVIFTGLVVNKVMNTVSGNMWSWVFLWVLIMTLCNAMGSVANEFALKRNRDLDINLQNMVLYTACILCSFIFLACTDSSRFTSAGAFFGGFDSKTYITAGLQAVAGLMVSRLLKYADAVMKTVATCLRGPVLVFVAPLFVTSAHDVGTILSALIVASGCLTYLTQGPMNAGTPAPAKAVDSQPVLAAAVAQPVKAK